MIELINISKSFAGQKVLNNISTVFDKGKTNLIIGQSGSGKTVLMKCCIGLLGIDEGVINFDELCFSGLSEKKKRTTRKKMGVLFQGGALFDSFTVEENVIAGGFGSAVMERLQSLGINTPVIPIGLPDQFLPHGVQDFLRQRYGLDVQGIYEKLKQTFLRYGTKSKIRPIAFRKRLSAQS
jgi:ABC-type sugar transport system ATPase subunit